jgi:hypothetical protein
VGAASTKSRRPGTAGWGGRGERNGKVYERNRCCYASLRSASSNPVDVGWFAMHTCPVAKGAGNSRSGLTRSGLEATVKVYGVTVGDVAGVEPGASPVDRTAVNVGTIRVRSPRLPRPEGLGWG